MFRPGRCHLHEEHWYKGILLYKILLQTCINTIKLKLYLLAPTSAFCIKNTHIYIRDILEDDLCGSKRVAKHATINSTS